MACTMFSKMVERTPPLFSQAPYPLRFQILVYFFMQKLQCTPSKRSCPSSQLTPLWRIGSYQAPFFQNLIEGLTHSRKGVYTIHFFFAKFKSLINSCFLKLPWYLDDFQLFQWQYLLGYLNQLLALFKIYQDKYFKI